MIASTKEVLRTKMRQQRDNWDKGIATAASLKICESVLGLDEFKSARTVALYIPKGSEVDVKPLILQAIADKEVLVPVISSDNHIEFVKFTSFDDLKPAKFGILEPKTKINPNREPDIVIVPGLAFDIDFHRLGYGKGYYDKLFARLKTFKLGVCFDLQIVEKIPRHEHDVRLDCVVSEKRVLGL
ncbi:MAG: 5-formyltetrahydrofolate cyclo-ligase [Candidatus Micrarchaeota archaeon]